MWQFLICLVMAGILVTLLCRLWKESDALAEPQEKGSATRRELGRLFLAALGFRLAVYLLSAVVLVMLQEGDVPFTFQSFLEGWKRWDGSNYLAIAEQGYAGSLVDGKPLFLVFFPLYSYLIRLFTLVTGNSMVSALLISTLAYAAGCCYLYALAIVDYGREAARNAVVLLSVFPFAFFFGSMMSESVFFLLSVMTLYYARRRRWAAASLAGLFASMTRMHGLLLLLPCAIEWCGAYRPVALLRRKDLRGLGRAAAHALWFPLMGLGTLYYLAVNYHVTGSAFAFLTYQREHWFQGPCFFTQTLEYVFRNAFSGPPGSVQVCIWIPEALLFLLCTAVLIYAARRYRVSQGAYLLVYLLLNYSVTWLLSGGRYLSCAVPLFLFGGEFCARHGAVKRWAVLLSALLFAAYLTGHLMWKQIM